MEKCVFATYPSLKNRKVLVTGGATGIGAAFVEQFHLQGCKVALLDINQKAGEALAKRLGNDSVHFFPCDLRNMADLKKAVEEAAIAMSGLDILLNNAADGRRHDFLSVHFCTPPHAALKAAREEVLSVQYTYLSVCVCVCVCE